MSLAEQLALGFILAGIMLGVIVWWSYRRPDPEMTDRAREIDDCLEESFKEHDDA